MWRMQIVVFSFVFYILVLFRKSYTCLKEVHKPQIYFFEFNSRIHCKKVQLYYSSLIWLCDRWVFEPRSCQVFFWGDSHFCRKSYRKGLLHRRVLWGILWRYFISPGIGERQIYYILVYRRVYEFRIFISFIRSMVFNHFKGITLENTHKANRHLSVIYLSEWNFWRK